VSEPDQPNPPFEASTYGDVAPGLHLLEIFHGSGGVDQGQGCHQQGQAGGGGHGDLHLLLKSGGRSLRVYVERENEDGVGERGSRERERACCMCVGVKPCVDIPGQTSACMQEAKIVMREMKQPIRLHARVCEADRGRKGKDKQRGNTNNLHKKQRTTQEKINYTSNKQ
jgi:hypothetical protein